MFLLASNPRRTLVVAALAVAEALTISACSTEPNPPPDLALALAPTPISVVQGATGISVATITRPGAFTGPATLSAIVPAGSGVNVTFSPGVIAAGTTKADVNVAVDPSASPGPRTITINAAGSGVTTATASLVVTVTAASGGQRVTFTFCAGYAPIWAAAQDGATGAWIQQAPPSGTTYQIALTSGKGGVAFVHADDGTGGTILRVFYGTLADLTGNAAEWGSDCRSTKTVNGSLSGVGATANAFVALGSSSATIAQSTPGFPSFAVTNVAEGSLDLIATRTDVATSEAASSIILRRGLTQPNSSTMPVLDFDGSEAFAPVTANITVAGLGSDEAWINTQFHGLNGSTFAPLDAIGRYTSGDGAVPYSAIPGPKLTPGELQRVAVVATDPFGTDAARLAGVYFRAPGDRIVTLGPVLSNPTVTKVATPPNAWPRIQLLGQSAYDKALVVYFSQGTFTVTSVVATAAYLGGPPATWDVGLPNLSGVSGWDDAWGLKDADPIDWDVFVTGGNIRELVGGVVDGDTYQYGERASGSSPLELRGIRGATTPFAGQQRLPRVLKH